MRSAMAMGSSATGAAAADSSSMRFFSSSFSIFCRRYTTNAAVAAMAAKTKNGNLGMPGSTASAASRKAQTPSTLGRPPSCPNKARSVAIESPALVTTKPAAVATIRAGICVTKPSPTVRRV